jgi:hypothetical protein
MLSVAAMHNELNQPSQFSRSHYAVIRVYDHAGNVIETHEHKGDFREEFPHFPFSWGFSPRGRLVFGGGE